MACQMSKNIARLLGWEKGSKPFGTNLTARGNPSPFCPIGASSSRIFAGSCCNRSPGGRTCLERPVTGGGVERAKSELFDVM